MRVKKVKVGNDLFQLMEGVADLSNSEILRMSARKIYNGKIKCLPAKKEVLEKPVHIIDVSLPDHLYNVPAQEMRIAARMQLSKIKRVNLIIDKSELKYKPDIDKQLKAVGI